ncbi:MAG TPA: NUDIX domain-containing protein [Terriglobales bacterium]|nr:NUDIX domain-containing protein [Terriglobales bacterium]
MHSAAVRAGSNGEILGKAPLRPAAKFLRLAHLRRLKECEKVAAVCYRIRPNGIQFLLVQTKRGRWTFPKGSVEPGLTHAQAAALEAFEEAGVHGRMEEASFTHYRHHKWRNSAFTRIKVSAHLCEVTRLEPPPEPGRNRTWFSAEKAKDRLKEDRKPDHGNELARVVDRAMVRIERSQQVHGNPPQKISAEIVLIEGTRQEAHSSAALAKM